MTVKRGSLGRNLTALLGQSHSLLLSDTPVNEQLSLNLTSLQPGKYQPRKAMDDPALEELAHSIRQQGILQPLIVREISQEKYEIIAGERRWRAAQRAGLKEVPAILRQVNDETAMALALVENLQREDLNAMDQARAIQRLVTEFSLTHQQIAELLSKSRASVSNSLRLLALSHEVKQLLEQGRIDMGHARALLALNETQQIQAVKMVLARGLSVRETERLVARFKIGQEQKTAKIEIPPLFQERVQLLAKQLQAPIKLKSNLSGKGRLVIHYDDLKSLDSILHRLAEKNH